jgi:uncharacterized protein (UPF0297 family)
MSGETQKFNMNLETPNKARDIIMLVCDALEVKGYNPMNQLAGYLLSGDPTYITSHNGARNAVRKLERDEIIEELVKYYLQDKK